MLLAIGIVGSSAYQTQREFQVKQGQTFHMPGYTAKFLGLQHKTDVTASGNSVETTALLDVNGRFNGTHDDHLGRTPRRSASRTRSASTPTTCGPRTTT